MVRLVVHPQLCMVFPATVHISGHDKLAQGIDVDLKRPAYDLNSFSPGEHFKKDSGIADIHVEC